MTKLRREENGNARRYLSAPVLNKINNEVYVEGRRSIVESGFGNSKMSFRNKRSKSFISGVFSPIGSSTHESLSWTLVDVDIDERTSVQADNAKNSSVSKGSRDESPRINEAQSSMTQAYSVSRGPADPDGSAGAPLSTTKNFDSTEIIQSSCSSKARQKKFHRHFKQVDIEEKVLNYYSCALVGDILLQGHLYITENFFAFYSNVFGYVTKLLIPMVNVLKISKEKTAKIIPNAVGISTEDEKHVFGSLLSRDSTYKFMLQVWKAANSSHSVANITPPPIIKTEMPSDEDSSMSTGNDDPTSFISNLNAGASSENLQKILPAMKRKSIMMAASGDTSRFANSFKLKLMLTICVALLIFLFASAGYLLYRIAIIRNHFNDLSIPSKSTDTYEDILKWHATMHSSSANKIYEFLNANLHQIIRVRLSLEALSMVTPGKAGTSDVNSKWGGTKAKEGDKGPPVRQEIFS